MKLLSCIIPFLFLLKTASGQCPPTEWERVFLIGDSWAEFMYWGNNYSRVFDEYGFDDIRHHSDNSLAIGGTGPAYWADPGNLANITNTLAGYPNVDLVMLSIGGNDLWCGMPDCWFVGISQNDKDALLDQIEADMQTVVDGILGVRSDIEVLLLGADNLNFTEPRLWSPGGIMEFFWENLNEPTPFEANDIGRELDLRKIDIANGHSRVFYTQQFGLMQWHFGYPNPLPVPPNGTFAPYTVTFPGQSAPNYAPYPGGNLDYPSPPESLRCNGTCDDGFHLNDEGYDHLVRNQTDNYFLSKFRGSPDATFSSQGSGNDGWASSASGFGTSDIRLGDNAANHRYCGILSFDTSPLPSNASVTKASIFIQRNSATGNNPFTSAGQGVPTVDIANGSFGAPAVEGSDFSAAASATDVGCFIGTAGNDGHWVRIDLSAGAFTHFNTAGTTQFRLSFPNATGAGDDFLGFAPGGGGGAPFIDLEYSLVLPAELVFFEIKKATEGQVALHWATAAEEGVSHFQVERSMDGVHFFPIGKTSARGSASDYQFMDEQPVFNVSLYYRLRTVDMDGRFEFSPIKNIYLKNNAPQTGLRLSPNPWQVGDPLWVEVSRPSEGTLRIHDFSGKILSEMPVKWETGKNRLVALPVGLPRGAYLLSFHGAGWSVSQKLMVF